MAAAAAVAAVEVGRRTTLRARGLGYAVTGMGYVVGNVVGVLVLAVRQLRLVVVGVVLPKVMFLMATSAVHVLPARTCQVALKVGHLAKT